MAVVSKKIDNVLRIYGKIAITSLKGRYQYPVGLMCKALDLSPRTWHGRLSRELVAPTPAQIKLNRLSFLLRGAFKVCKGIAARRLTHHLHVHKWIAASRRHIMAIKNCKDGHAQFNIHHQGNYAVTKGYQKAH